VCTRGFPLSRADGLTTQEKAEADPRRVLKPFPYRDESFPDETMLRLGIPGIGRRRQLVFLALVICALSIVDAASAEDSWTGFSTSCATEDSKNMSVSCHGVRIVRKIVQQLLETTSKERDIELFDGVSLIEVPGSNRKSKALKGFGGLGPFLQFLEGRELRIKLPSLLPPNIETALKESLPSEFEGW